MATLTKRDESVRIPPAVRAAAARANALVEAGNAPQEQEQAAQPEEQPQEQTPQDGQPPLTATTPAQPPQEAAQPPQEAPRQRTPDEWEHAFNSVNERYRQAVRQNNDLNRKLEALTQQVTELQQRAPELQASRLISPEEQNEWGNELLTVVGKKAKEELLPEIEQLRRDVNSIKGQVTASTEQVSLTAREQMFASLDRALPDWRALNTNAQFVAWLGLPDGFSDDIRQTRLDEAVGRNDAAKVLQFFRGFLAEEAATAPRPQPAPARVQADPLTRLAAPGRARTAAATNAPAEKPYFTTQQISEFYVNVRQGKFRGKEDEKAALEAQIFEAQREGRVTA
jgi:hypothetical protein